MGEPAAGNPPQVVLVVEPSPSLASLVSSILTKEGYLVVTAATADEALTHCGKLTGLDLLVTEALLPGGKGRDLAKRVTKLHPGTEVLYLSSVAEEMLQKMGIGDRAKVLRKPVALSDLVSHVHQLLSRRGPGQ